MIGSILQTCRVVVDPLVWEVLLIILGITAVLGLVYLLRIHIAYRMAKNVVSDEKQYKELIGKIIT